MTHHGSLDAIDAAQRSVGGQGDGREMEGGLESFLGSRKSQVLGLCWFWGGFFCHIHDTHGPLFPYRQFKKAAVDLFVLCFADPSGNTL